MNRQKPLTLNDRISLQQARTVQKSFKGIFRVIGQDPTTVFLHLAANVVGDGDSGPYSFTAGINPYRASGRILDREVVIAIEAGVKFQPGRLLRSQGRFSPKPHCPESGLM